MKIALNVLKWIAGILLGFIIIVGLCWWLIPDEELNLEAEKLMAIAPAPPAAKNAYFMIYGFAASPELDPHAVGQQIVAAHDRIVASEKDLSKFKLEPFFWDSYCTFCLVWPVSINFFNLCLAQSDGTKKSKQQQNIFNHTSKI